MISVSIIMPSLNVAKYIHECIQSVINQTLRDIEILCVDAGSTDGTLEIIQKYAKKDSRIKILHSDMKSYGYQMNMALRVAQGEYIGIVETDDVILPEMFEHLYNQTKRCRVDFVKSNYLNYFRIDGKKQCIEVINSNTIGMSKQVLHLENCPKYRLADINHIWSAIYRKDFLLNNNLWFNETLGASFQDTSFSILVGMMAKDCIYMPECYYQYRIDRPESSVRSDQKVFCVRDEFRYIENYLREHNFDEKQILRDISPKKVDVYWWNMCRLSEKARREFGKGIRSEIKKIRQHHYETKDQEQIVERMLDEEKVEQFLRCKEKKKNNFIKIIHRAEQYHGYVVIGAGRFLDRMLTIQRLSGEYIIKAVCDNNAKVQGTYKGDYQIKSVEDAIRVYGKEQWLILNRYNSDEIKKQLLRQGIDEERIDLIDTMPEWTEIYEEICFWSKE